MWDESNSRALIYLYGAPCKCDFGVEVSNVHVVNRNPYQPRLTWDTPVTLSSITIRSQQFMRSAARIIDDFAVTRVAVSLAARKYNLKRKWGDRRTW
jgi:hypothetical protein